MGSKTVAAAPSKALIKALRVALEASLLPGDAGADNAVLEEAATWLLSAAAIIGNVALAGVGEHWLAVIRCFAAGAVVASLATEVFPKAYREDHHLAGIATALGVVLAFGLGSLAGS